MGDPKIRVFTDENGIEVTETTFDDYIQYEYINEDGVEVIQTSNGFLSIGGDVVAEPLNDIDKHSGDVISGYGYFDSDGIYHKYNYPDE